MCVEHVRLDGREPGPNPGAGFEFSITTKLRNGSFRAALQADRKL